MDWNPADPIAFSHQFVQLIQQTNAEIDTFPHSIPGVRSCVHTYAIREQVKQLDNLLPEQITPIIQAIKEADPDSPYTTIPILMAELKRVKDPTWFDEANYL